MPRAVYLLGLAIFAQGTSELMLAGLLPEIATDLNVSIPAAGLLISSFAVGMLVGAPILAFGTLRWSRRAAMLAFLTIFALTHVAGALTSSYGVLLATRVAGAFVYAGFWAVASVTAIELAGPEARARAMSVLAGGLTVATIVGLPAGTLLGQHLGWRSAFWAVAVLSALAFAGVVTTIPRGRSANTPQLGRELRSMANPQLWLAYATTALSTGAILVIFSYLAPLLTETTGLAAGWIPVILALYGVGALIGITISGRTSDRRPFGTLVVSLGGVIAAAVLLALATGTPWLAVPAIIGVGTFGFATNPAVNSRVFTIAGSAPTLAAAFNISAFNIGITVGPWLGGLALAAGAGYSAVGWIGAALAVLALGTIPLALRATGRPRAERPAGDQAAYESASSITGA
ncbi:Cmx/CmrA family chloramphenicol efflux MFS transporter [Kribbella shirazensis]|uniref:DHA1 family chloramphenicol resistance protein-like MFS transporter n=1 Tax=Kribbella shirazensis TaxID=1105143 RepID=A0A7X5VEM6_9ACTN|nr:Cmx/CmrA family chloramphenicol efflux MFS transporter [Kribbella shirazensis]NIK59757.1 DHA1 family chloramphenicol resistance protein-like MFS transporter [Kribbella shirazensis]